MNPNLVRQYFINDKPIEIYDDVFSFGEMQAIYKYCLNSLYRPHRRALDFPGVDSKYTPTLKSTLSLPDLLNFAFFQSVWVRNFLKERKYRIASAYINLCTASDTYSFHTDNGPYGIPSMLGYLNMSWDPCWEGETHFSDEQGRDTLVSAGFIPGRIIVFDSSIPHKSSQPGPMADNYRYVLAIKLAIKGKKIWDSSFELDDFFFDANINTNEKENKAIDALKNLTQHIPHSGTTFFDHLFGTFCVLKKFNCDEDTCLAGLFHAIYGTEYFKNAPPVEEGFVKSLIGKKSNDLVKLFSTPNRDLNIINNLLNVDSDTHLKLLYILYANLIEQAHRTDINVDFIASIKNKIDGIVEK